MRLDLFLKHTRLMKRRSAAKELAAEGGALLNGHPAKPGRDVKSGDILTILDGSILDGKAGTPRRFKIVQEALRPVPKGREEEFFEILD